MMPRILSLRCRFPRLADVVAVLTGNPTRAEEQLSALYSDAQRQLLAETRRVGRLRGRVAAMRALTQVEIPASEFAAAGNLWPSGPERLRVLRRRADQALRESEA